MQVRRHLATALRLAGGAYPLLIYAACRNGIRTEGPWGLALLYFAVGLPLIFISLSVAKVWSGRHRWVRWLTFALLLLGLSAVIWWLAPQLRPHYQWFFLVQDLAFFILLAYYFGSSLRAGREPLCTFFARLVHPALSPELRTYTRTLTQVWVLFFLVICCISTYLFFSSSSSTWAFFTNLLTPILVIAFFAIENACRRVLLPPQDQVGWRGTFLAIRQAGFKGAGQDSAARPRTVG